MPNKKLKKALCIGINNYRQGKLNYAVSDAMNFASLLEIPEYSFEVDLLLDAHATRIDIKSKLIKLFESNPDFALIYFAGHAVINKYGLFLVTYDYSHIELGFDFEELKKLMIAMNLPSSNLLIILDCCHSGFADLEMSEIQSISNQDIIDKTYFLDQGKILLAACSTKETTKESQKKESGIYTHCLLEGMFGEASDKNGNITVNNLHSYIIRKFKDLDIIQSPVMKGGMAGEIVIGTGFPARDLKEESFEIIQKINEQASNFINQYKQSLKTDVEIWEHSGYKEACNRLEPILKWFDEKINSVKNIKSEKEFIRAYSSTLNELTNIGRLVEGFVTSFGTIGKKIGSGGFGTVWKLQNNMTTLAYKVYHPNELDDKTKLDRFKRGYEAMKQLDHSHIVKVHTYTQCPVGFTMDYIEGANVRQFVGMNNDPVQLTSILYSIADTLHHAHSRGVIHRDIKPENIIIKTNYINMDYDKPIYEAYLTDFDLSWFETAKSIKTNESLGTLIYAPPEQLANPKKAHNKSVDIYAFGRFLYYVLLRHDPSMDNRVNLPKIEKLVGSWPSSIASQGIVKLFKECTQQIPTDRIENFLDIMDILSEVLNELRSNVKDKNYDYDGFIKELTFQLNGFSDSESTILGNLTSNSGQTNIIIEGKELASGEYKITSSFHMLDSFDTSRASKDRVNERIRELIKGDNEIRFKAQKPGQFIVIIEMFIEKLNRDGIEKCRNIITRIINCIEMA